VGKFSNQKIADAADVPGLDPDPAVTERLTALHRAATGEAALAPGSHPRAELQAALAHLARAERACEQALLLDPSNPSIPLTLGWVREVRLAAGEGDPRWVLVAYREVYLRAKAQGLGNEAGEALLRVESALPPEQRDARELLEVGSLLDHARRRKRITPILVSLSGSRSLDALVDSQAHVRFDLDASGEERAWPWPTPEAGLLAWDPDGCGRILDGEQLFGTATWWAFWRSGYSPLAALDDDGDGLLTGEELTGLVVWIDRNGDGVSGPGEVVDVRSLGIASFRVGAWRHPGGVLWNPRGAVFRDGREMPTFDWTPTSDPERVAGAR
jgi:hypothetical protein